MQQTTDPSSITTSFGQAQQQLESEYPLPASPFKSELLELAFVTQQQAQELQQHQFPDEAMAVNNMLYLIMDKYFSKVPANEDSEQYLIQLITALKSAKHEFSQVCYASEVADQVLQSFRQDLNSAS